LSRFGGRRIKAAFKDEESAWEAGREEIEGVERIGGSRRWKSAG
jgi:hypothetical protein